MGIASIAPRSGRTVEVAEVRDPQGFQALAAEWNALVRASDDQFFYRHEFLTLWLRHFAPHERMRVLVLRMGGELQAALPLLERTERTERIYGIVRRALCAAANAHSGRFDLIARDPRVAADAFLDHLLQCPDWDLLRLSHVPVGGSAGALVAAAATRGLPWARQASIRSPFLPLPARADAPGAGLSRNFRANLRRGRRRLLALGPLTLERCDGGDTLAATLAAGLELERAGWKGRMGTAMCQHEDTRGFYTELAETAAGLGALSLYTLRQGMRAVAFHYALEYRGRYLLLKPVYDETVADCSPGHLAMESVLHDCTVRGLRELDLLGNDARWKRAWTPRSRGHEKLLVFRDTPLNRLLCGAKFRWAPATRRALSRISGR